MDEITREITLEEYEKLQLMTYAEQQLYFFPDGIPSAWEYGYGYYGHRIYEKGGKYYRTFQIGSSCD